MNSNWLHTAIELRPGLFSTDDTAARLAAGSFGITTHGMLGILIRATRDLDFAAA